VLKPTTNKYYKIGKIGVKSKARYYSQHYKQFLAKSSLANSLLNLPDNNILPEKIDSYIKDNTNRYNIKLDTSYGIFLLNFFEAFLHCKLKPEFEGFKNQIN